MQTKPVTSVTHSPFTLSVLNPETIDSLQGNEISEDIIDQVVSSTNPAAGMYNPSAVFRLFL